MRTPRAMRLATTAAMAATAATVATAATATTAATAATAAVAAAGLVTAVSAQEPPNLSGTWSAAGGGRGRGGSSGDPGSGWGQTFTIAQAADRMTVARPFFTGGDLQPDPTFHYVLDGSTSVNTLLMGRGIQEQSSRARWEGDRLVIVTVHTAPGALDGETVTSEVRHTLWLEPSRSLTGSPSLVIETTRSGVMGGATSTTRTVHTRG